MYLVENSDSIVNRHAENPRAVAGPENRITLNGVYFFLCHNMWCNVRRIHF